MGFCIFNNVAVGVAHALAQYKLQRVAIVDFDVHYGNGTEDIFRNESRVLLCSTFQHPFYPYTGTEAHSENIINIPLPASTNGSGLKNAFERDLLPRLDTFQPELIFFSAGFDGHVEDDMAHMNLTEQDYAWITRQVKLIADKYSEGRMISVLEGGYALSALGRSVMMHLKAMLGE
jgi:acetoin utilization deacetylase AcuC-like enzyme